MMQKRVSRLLSKTLGACLSTKPGKILTAETINANMKNCKYAVRGEIYLASLERTSQGKEVIQTNVGNPQALGQPPITFTRQVLALAMAPFLMENPNVTSMFAPDAIERAKTYLKAVDGGLGAYSDSRGVSIVRKEVAEYIERQSGFPSNPDHIFLSNGASECVRNIMSATIRGPDDGIMVSIPQYPLYSASIALYGGQLIPYYLKEEEGWSLDIKELQRSLDEAKSKGVTVRAFVFINPGNPTGQCLKAENLEELIKFCYENRLVMCADEVYQENIYNVERPFVSCRKVLGSMPEPYSSGTELVSFHTISKGVYGECGLRGGYMELYNMDPSFVEEIYKVASINLCANLPGQIAMGLMVNPPKPGDFSYEGYRQEKEGLLSSLKRRAKLIADTFNSLEGVSCQQTDGAMYSFPKITLPPAAIKEAERQGKAPDVMYCLELLNETGLSCVPGSGFQQAPGTFHIRTTILPQEDKFQDIADKFVSFHKNFMSRYAQ